MASSDLMKEALICIVTDTIFLNPNQCMDDISKLNTALPCLTQRGNRHIVNLWDREVGILDTHVSETIVEISKLKIVKLQITFASTPVLNTAIVVKVNLSASVVYAPTIISIIRSIFGEQFSRFVVIPAAISATPNVQFVLSQNAHVTKTSQKQPPEMAISSIDPIPTKKPKLPETSIFQSTSNLAVPLSPSNYNLSIAKSDLTRNPLQQENIEIGMNISNIISMSSTVASSQSSPANSIVAGKPLTTTLPSDCLSNKNSPENTNAMFLNVRIKQEKVDSVGTSQSIGVAFSTLTYTSSPIMSSSQPVNTQSTSLATTNTNNDFASILNNTMFPRDSTIEGEPTSMSDLPPEILKKVNVFNRGQSNFQGEFSHKKSANLLDGRGNICSFLLSKDGENQGDRPPHQTEDEQGPNGIVSSNSSASNAVDHRVKEEHYSDGCGDNDEDDEELGFSGSFWRRRRHRQRIDPTSHIGASTNELYEDPADVSRRNWGHEVSGVDSADTMFSTVPPPAVKMDELDELFDALPEFQKDATIEPCGAISREMLPHQKMALRWMIERENSKQLPPFWECIKVNRDYFNTATRKRMYERPPSVKGGILADDMGLGKTLTTIALILTNHVNEKPMFAAKKSLPTEASEIAAENSKIKIKRKKDGYKSTTKGEFSKPGFQFRQIYLQQVGKKKKKKSKKKSSSKEKTKERSESLFSSDSDNENDVRHVNKTVNNVLNSAAVKDDTLSFTPKSKAKPMFGQAPTDRKMTVIVCPMSVLSNWTDQFQEHVSPTINLQIYVYYGPDRVRDLSFLTKHDIIITTYGTLSGDFRALNVKNKPSPLHKINWLRVILDEGHIIRNSRSQTTTAMMNLNSDRRWLLTGTPIQNRMTDLWSMVKFLRMEPFTNRKWWFDFIVASMKRHAAPGEIVYNRVKKLIDHMAIRRSKTDFINGLPIVDLPPKRVIIQRVKFNEDERKMYDAMHKDGKLVVCKYIKNGTVMKNYANVLVIIMRLRQLCCHPNLCINAVKKLQKALQVMDQLQGNMNQALENDGEGEEEGNADLNDGEREKLIQQLMQLLNSGDSEECSICLEILQDPVITKCAHVFCSNCINEVVENTDLAPVCPLCRADIDQSSMVKVPESCSKAGNDEEENSVQDKTGNEVDGDDEQWIPSSKVDALMHALTIQRESDHTIKTLVVSQFTSFLDILEKPLRKEGFSFVRLDGKMSQVARARVIDEFQKDDDYSPTVMLLSLTAGGVGLNLTAANRVFLLDPAWNPAIEDQCFDRAHRMGQKKDVVVIKFIVEDTVEDRMLILQKQKRELMEKAFGIRQQSPEERRTAALRDIATLLNINIPR